MPSVWYGRTSTFFTLDSVSKNASDSVKILIVIGHAWNEDMADPHGFADLIQVSGEGQNIFVGMAGESAVLFRIDVF